MKNILIIGERRSGTSNLLKSIAEGMNWRSSFEPNIYGLVPFGNKLVTKLVVSEYHEVDFYLDICKRYDKIILLSRKSIKQQAEALWALFHLVQERGNPVLGWKEDKLPSNLETLPSFVSILKQLQEDKVKLKSIASILNLPIYFYEDIYYDGKRIDGVKFNEKYLKTSRKLRTKSNAKLI